MVRNKVVAGIVILALVVAGAGIGYAKWHGGGSSKKKDLVVLSQVTRQTLQDTVTLTGTLARQELRKVTSVAQGRVSAATPQTGNALAIVPSTKKVGAPGSALDVPLTHINAAYVRSHFDAIEVRVPGSPLPDEIVFILVMSTGPRVHARVGGLKAADIAQWNGLR